MRPTFLFLNLSGDFLGIQSRIEAEGYSCFGFYDPSSIKGKYGSGEGIIKLLTDPYDLILEYEAKPDDLIILVDDNSWGDEMDFLRKKGFKIIGSSCLSDRVEHNRAEGNKLAKSIGLTIPNSYSFSSLEEAETFLKDKAKTEKFVFKGDGMKLAGSSKTYLAENVADMLRYLKWLKTDQLTKDYQIENFELQEIVEGVEVDIAAWFNGKSFSSNASVTFEQKRLQGLGAAQGCYGQILTFIPINEPYKDYFLRLQSTSGFSESGANEWAINAIVNSSNQKPNFLEWTPRFGWDSMFGELALLQDESESIAKFFIRVAFERNIPRSMLPVGKYSAAVRLFSESPGTEGKQVEGKPIWIDQSIKENIWFYSVRKEEGNFLITDNPFAVATAVGDTPEEAANKLYKMLDPASELISTPDLFYSKHILEGVREKITSLERMNILKKY